MFYSTISGDPRRVSHSGRNAKSVSTRLEPMPSAPGSDAEGQQQDEMVLPTLERTDTCSVSFYSKKGCIVIHCPRGCLECTQVSKDVVNASEILPIAPDLVT